jgi:hypothetical protein
MKPEGDESYFHIFFALSKVSENGEKMNELYVEKHFKSILAIY